MTSEILLRRPQPYQDEILASYITRLADSNCYDLSLILKLAKLKGKVVIHTLNILDTEEELSSLSQLTKVPREALISMAFLKVGKNTGKTYVQTSPNIIVPTFAVNHVRQRVCTQCLLEAKYIRKAWSFVPMTVCPIHSCFLIDKCPNCSNFLSWNKHSVALGVNRIVTCKSCGFDLCESFPSVVDSTEEVILSTYIHKKLNPSFTNITYIESSNPILNLEMNHLCWTICFFATQFLTPGYFVPDILFELSSNDLHDLIFKVFLLFENLFLNYYFFLEWLKYQYALFGNQSKINLYKRFEERFYKFFQPEIYPFLIFDLDEYLQQFREFQNGDDISVKMKQSSFVKRYVDSKGSLIKYDLGKRIDINGISISIFDKRYQDD